MKRFVSSLIGAVLIVLGCLGVQAQQGQVIGAFQIPPELMPESREVDAGGLALFLKDLQPKSNREAGGRLEVVASYLHPALVGSFDAMAHGWCEGQVFLGCGTSHFPISVTILTGNATREFFRVPATEKWLALPGGLSRHAAPVYLLKNPPSSAVWLAWGRNGEQFVLTGPLLNGTGGTATIIKAASLATVLHKQMFLSELINQSSRWRP